MTDRDQPTPRHVPQRAGGQNRPDVTGERREDGWSLVVDGLAAYRLVKLVRDDYITEPMRQAVLASQGPADRSKVSYLLQCPWCLSIWFGGGLTLGRRKWPRATSAVARALAISAVTGLVTERLEQ